MNKILFLFAVLGCCCGCNEKPAQDYDYISLSPTAGWQKGEELTFSLQMEDTLRTYALYFTGQIRNTRLLSDMNAFPAKVTIQSPSGKQYSSIISLPLNITQQRGHYRLSNGIMEIEWPFLRNVRNRECGIWKITLTQTAEAEIYKNITGLGISYKEEQN